MSDDFLESSLAVIGKTIDAVSRGGFGESSDLEQIKSEIVLYLQASTVAVVRIGQLLTLAKSACQQNKIGFEDWCKKEFEFSPQTCRNYMGAWELCCKYPGFTGLKNRSLLYELAAPSTPPGLLKELEGRLPDETTRKDFQEIKKAHASGDAEKMALLTKQRNDVERVQRLVLKAQNAIKSIAVEVLNLTGSADSKGNKKASGEVNTLRMETYQKLKEIGDTLSDMCKELDPTKFGEAQNL
jgi:hypothetical protein